MIELTKEPVAQDGIIVFKQLTKGEIEDVLEAPPGLMLINVTHNRVVEAHYVRRQNKQESRTYPSKLGDVEKIERRFIPFKELGTVDFLGKK